MSSNDQRLDTTQSLGDFIQEQHAAIRRAVGLTFHLYHHPASQDVIDDLTAEIEYLLLKDNFHYLRSFKQQSSFNTWLKRIVMHHIGHYLSRQRKQPANLDEVETRSLFYQAPQEKKAINQELLRIVKKAVAQLSEREQLHFKLCVIEECETQEIALTLGIKIESVYQRKSTILKKLRLLIDEEQKRVRKM